MWEKLNQRAEPSVQSQRRLSSRTKQMCGEMYFDIFLGRMQMCRHDGAFLGVRFKLMANGSKVL